MADTSVARARAVIRRLLPDGRHAAARAPVDEARVIERASHITKLTLLEVFPLYPFLLGRDRMNVVEVGGHIGLWCEAFHDVFGHRIGSYRAYEPMPGNATAFRRRLAEHMTGHTVELTQACVGDARSPATIHYSDPVTPLASVAVRSMQAASTTIDHDKSLTVSQVMLDDELGGRRVDLVKIDTEGYEWNVLQGARRCIDSGVIDNVFFEFGAHQGHLGQSFRQFFDFFHERGWRVFRQQVGRAYFGLNEIRRCGAQFEDFSSMWMILASRHGPSEEYRGPRVTGRIN